MLYLKSFEIINQRIQEIPKNYFQLINQYVLNQKFWFNNNFLNLNQFNNYYYVQENQCQIISCNLKELHIYKIQQFQFLNKKEYKIIIIMIIEIFQYKIIQKALYYNYLRILIIMADDRSVSLHTPLVIEDTPSKVVFQTKRNKANIISKLFFGWVYDTLRIASTVTLENEMIEDLEHKEQSQQIYDHFLTLFQEHKDEQNGLIKALFKSSKTQCVIIFFVMLLAISAQLCNPLLIKQVIDYLIETDKKIETGILLICGIVLARFISVICAAHSMSLIRSVGYDWMTVISMALLGKSMNVSFTSNKQHSSGQVLNYMQVDAMKLQWLGWYLSQVLLMPIQLGVSFYMMFSFIGVSFLGGTGVIILTALFNIYVGKKMIQYQTVFMKDKDKRTKCANEIFQQIKFIKVNAFEEFFRNKLEQLRNQEIKTLRVRFFISCLNILSIWLSPMLILNATFAIFVSIGNDLTPSKTFAIISLFQMLQQPLLFLPMALNALIEANISLRRIQNFLLTEERMMDCIEYYNIPTAIEIYNGTFYWQLKDDEKKEQQPPQQQQIQQNTNVNVSDSSIDTAVTTQPKTQVLPRLQNINIVIPKGQFVAIVGDVGSGKSSLLQAMLGEMLYKEIKPQVILNGTTAYVSQKAWIQNATVKDNIIFGFPFDQVKYDDAIRYSCLKDDLKILVNGDQTMIGEKGVNLSGGQKARITLARAVYSSSDIYLLDDPISAVDVHVGKAIIHDCLNGYLKDKTRILVTHALNYCQFTDYVYLMEAGQIVEQGTFQEIKKSERFNLIYSKFYKDVNQQESEDIQEVVDTKVLKLEKKQSLMQQTQAVKDKVDELMLLEDRKEGNINKEVLFQYVKLNGGYLFFAFLNVMMVLWIACYIGSSLWMAHWTQVSDQNQKNDVETTFSLSYGVLAFLRSWILVLQSSKSATKLHNKMVSCLIYAPLCQFFERVPLGRILNRFTKDQNVLDTELHWTLNWMLVQVYLLFANTFLNVFTSSYYVVIPIILYFLLAWKIQRLYMKASRELYRLESISKSPILSYFTESIMGITVVRAFQRQEQVMHKHALNQDINRKIFLEQIATNAWFSQVLGLSSFMVNITALIFCIFYSNENPAFAGLLMTYASTLDSNISSTVQCLGSMENSMISFERCVAYTKIQPERGYEKTVERCQNNLPIEDLRIENWPKTGSIEYKDYSVQYRENLPPALKNLTIQIKSKEKIGVVGRTGAGKSTITLSLLRILEAMKGQIFIDGVDISTLSLAQLRESITMILQDATIFDGTIRDNIDPLKEQNRLRNQ
ncbi:hypothetical protein pb186bvf_006426 [Paramecium bursaria]